ncbi:hypothetical protein Patl1_22577 [Pistacia atlantica]|uniref:Uncharacterized protein n=1 Tax=Pistacia atlantica TaxID=434234 RepID=A0ACC0ZZS2_9ROSI|nr:hypothetical protein Patl1_22577 [Pistacia atlantica]
MGGVVHTIVAPIEGAKLLSQTQDSNLTIVGSGRRKFKGMLDCIVRIVREEGILSLCRGNGSSVLRYYPSVALNFSFKIADSNRLESDLDELNCSLDLGASQLGQGIHRLIALKMEKIDQI